MAFDLLYCDRSDIPARPLRDRRARLEDIVANGDLVFPGAPARGQRPGGLGTGARARL